jgi:glycosyltransferase involved in cell wall biosynthesis
VAKRILIICDDPTLNTGYARVGRFIAKTLAAGGYRVRYAPCNAVMPEVDRKQWQFELDAFNPNDRYYNKTIAATLSQYKPALVIVLGEFSFVGYIGSACRQFGIRSLYYCPVEGDHYPPSLVYLSGGHVDYKLTLLKFNYIVAYSEFGARNINALMPGIVTDVLPHQVDTTIFRPLDRRACLNTFFPNLMNDPNIGMDRMFIVGHVGRNQRRKGTDYVIAGFSDFVARYVQQEHPDHVRPYLFLTLDPKDTAGYNLYELVDRYKLRGKVIINPVIGGKNGPADNQLAEIYNTFDVALNPHRAEGYGLNVLESLACGIRTVTTDYATPAEFGRDCCELVKPSWMEQTVGTNCNWAVINPRDIGDALGKMYLMEYGATKIQHAPSVQVAQQFAETAVAPRWLKLLADMDLPELSNIEEVQVGQSQNDSIIMDYLNVVSE